MRFSVIVPTYNRLESLKDCLGSLLHQDYPMEEYEILVIDDGSSDKTWRYLRKASRGDCRVRVHSIQHRGAGAARNEGLRHARGELIAFTDDDCRVSEDWLRALENAFNESRSAAVAGSLLNGTSGYLATAQHLLNFSSWHPAGGKRFVADAPTANIAYRKDAIRGIQFPEHLPEGVYEDSLFNHSLRQRGGRILFCPSIKVWHKTWEHGQTMTRFLGIQRKAAKGFVGGGYQVHGYLGKALLRLPLLNLLCPRLLMVLGRCIRYRMAGHFLLCLPLLLLGEFYRGAAIVRLRLFLSPSTD